MFECGVYTYIHVWMLVNMHVCIHVCWNVCMYVRAFVCFAFAFHTLNPQTHTDRHV